MERQPLPTWPLTLVVVRSGTITRRDLPRLGTLKIGRDPTCELQLDDDGVSRLHAQIEISDRVRIVDLGSRNGTRAGGRKLRPNEPVELLQDEHVEVGGAVISIYPRGMEPAHLRESLDRAGAMVQVRNLCDRAADEDHGVLLVGESGVGKMRCARMIHAFSRRRGGPLEVVDCAAGRAEELELALFGEGEIAGALEATRGGTLVLRNLEALALELQSKLVAALDAGEVRRLGRPKPRPLDVRLIATTRDSVQALLQAGQVRRDFVFRVSRIVIPIPPLRERVGELVALAAEAIGRHASAIGREPPTVSPELLALVEEYDWPGNLRELDSRLGQAVAACDGDVLLPEHMPIDAPEAVDGLVPKEADERRRIIDALNRCAGNQSQAAKLLGMSRRTLVSRLERYAIPRPRSRPT